MLRRRLLPGCVLAVAALVLPAAPATAQTGSALAAPSNLHAKDVTNFARDAVRVRWENPAADEGPRRTGYELSRSTDGGDFEVISSLPPAALEHVDEMVATGSSYVYRIVALGEGGTRGDPVTMDAPIDVTLSGIVKFQRANDWFLWNRFWLMVIVAIFCTAVIYWIEHARKGRPLNVRKIAGLEAVDEAVGRATEMGRSCLFVPGIQDLNDIQTIAGITVLARVSKTAAEYDAKVEVPTARALVMTTARETVQAAFLSAGRPDAYNEDLIYYVSDEQFGYVAYLQGMMVREKPAACFYMGSFFAESLILAETGNAIGAIQVAGTAQPAQLPFFVAACDYTLIGEEFFAASAYLSGSAEELGSLKGQDVGKVIVAVGIVVGVALATLASVAGSETIGNIVTYLRDNVLT